MSQADFARELGVSQAFLSNLETNKTEMTVEMLRTIKAAFVKIAQRRTRESLTLLAESVR